MPILKRYFSKTNGNLTFPCDYLGRTVMVEIRLPLNRYDTEDEKMQSAIETSNYFKIGKVGMKVLRLDINSQANALSDEKPAETLNNVVSDNEAIKVTDDTSETEDMQHNVEIIDSDDNSEALSDSTESDVTAGVITNMTSVQDMASFLRKEPYRVHSSKLKTPQEIKAVADDLGLHFPNVVFE